MTHADTLRGMAKAFMTVGSYERVDALIAGAEALGTLDRVRNALSGIARERADYEAYLVRYGHHAEWYADTSDAYNHVLTLITEALEGETE